MIDPASPFRLLQQAQGGSNNLACAAIEPRGDLFCNEPLQLGRKGDFHGLRIAMKVTLLKRPAYAKAWHRHLVP